MGPPRSDPFRFARRQLVDSTISRTSFQLETDTTRSVVRSAFRSWWPVSTNKKINRSTRPRRGWQRDAATCASLSMADRKSQEFVVAVVVVVVVVGAAGQCGGRERSCQRATGATRAAGVGTRSVNIKTRRCGAHRPRSQSGVPLAPESMNSQWMNVYIWAVMKMPCDSADVLSSHNNSLCSAVRVTGNWNTVPVVCRSASDTCGPVKWTNK